MTRKVDGMTRSTVRRATLLLAGAALLLTTGIAVGQAASKTKSYTACATKKNVLTLSNSKGKCARGTHVVRLSARGPAGPAGPKGHTGATGPKGSTGVAGPPGPFPATLPHGKTITGAFDVASSNAAGGTADEVVSFPYPLASAVDSAHAPIVDASTGTRDPQHCAGSSAAPTAAPGYFCLYVAYTYHILTLTPLNLLNNPGASTTGAILQSYTTAGGSAAITGSWALTAP
jgi:hypothetical protein